MIRAIVTDIEGTTTRISFVHDVLFPYARARIPAWVAENAADPVLDEVRAESGARDLDGCVAALLGWMDEDRKITPLKAIQGRIWEVGFAAGELQGHVYPDVAPALRAWHARGLRLAVYSSGSVLAQQQLFGHSEAGDLRPLFSAWFDTTTGPKRESASYTRIAEALGCEPAEVLFLSDVQAELDAAAAAGLSTALLGRDGASGIPDFTAIEV